MFRVRVGRVEAQELRETRPVRVVLDYAQLDAAMGRNRCETRLQNVNPLNLRDQSTLQNVNQLRDAIFSVLKMSSVIYEHVRIFFTTKT